MAVFLSKTHSLFLKKAKQMCKAQKIGLCNKMDMAQKRKM